MSNIVKGIDVSATLAKEERSQRRIDAMQYLAYQFHVKQDGIDVTAEPETHYIVVLRDDQIDRIADAVVMRQNAAIHGETPYVIVRRDDLQEVFDHADGWLEELYGENWRESTYDKYVATSAVWDRLEIALGKRTVDPPKGDA